MLSIGIPVNGWSVNPLALVLAISGLTCLFTGCDRNEDQDDRQQLLTRLARQLNKMPGKGEHPKLLVKVEGRRKRLPLQGADNTHLILRDQKDSVQVPWSDLSPREIMGVVRATSGEDPKRLMLAGRLAIELGFLDEAGEFLMRAHQAHSGYLSKAQKLVPKLSPLSGSPLADAKNSNLPTIQPSQIHPHHPRLFSVKRLGVKKETA